MIYYLENNCKFHLYVNDSNVIFIEYEDALMKPICRSIRWKNKLSFKPDHMANIEEKLKSKDSKVRAEGKTLLEQTLKVKINGEVVGHYEGSHV